MNLCNKERMKYPIVNKLIKIILVWINFVGFLFKPSFRSSPTKPLSSVPKRYLPLPTPLFRCTLYTCPPRKYLTFCLCGICVIPWVTCDSSATRHVVCGRDLGLVYERLSLEQIIREITSGEGGGNEQDTTRTLENLVVQLQGRPVKRRGSHWRFWEESVRDIYERVVRCTVTPWGRDSRTVEP